ncbi:hypothetical protein ACJMK2_034504, partial [Sinanodonta woodiana]
MHVFYACLLIPSSYLTGVPLVVSGLGDFSFPSSPQIALTSTSGFFAKLIG